jgi:uncharacterized coiled-coil protein SlyX
MTETSTAGRKPKFTDDDIANAMANLRSKNKAITPTSVGSWLSEAGIAKAPNSEAIKKAMQRVLDREREEEERRLLAELPSWITDELEPGVAALTSHLQLMVAQVHEQMQQAGDLARREADMSIRLRDRRIGELEEQLADQRNQLEECNQELEEANRRVDELTATNATLHQGLFELKGANLALENIVRSFRPREME